MPAIKFWIMRATKHIILCLLLLTFSGCTSNKKLVVTNLEDQYGIAFKTLSIPDAAMITQRGKSRDVMADSAQGLWVAALVVAMQRGPIIRADRASGIIVAPPFALLVSQPGQRPRVSAMFMIDLYYNHAAAGQMAVAIKPEETEHYIGEIVDDIAAQASISNNLKPGGKWNYLSQ